MAAVVINLTCPGCGEPVDTSRTKCKYCGRTVLVSTFQAISSLTPGEANRYAKAYQKAATENADHQELNKALGLCFLKLKLFQKAQNAFDQAAEDNWDDSTIYYYQAVSILGNKMAFLHPRADIDKMMELISASIAIEPRGIYHYFLAYLKCDYFERKYLNITPDFHEELAAANQLGLANLDVNIFYEMTGLDCPESLS